MVFIGPQVCKWVNLTFSGYLTNWPHMIFDLHLWPLTSWRCEGSYIVSLIQVWFQSDFNFSNEVNFTFWIHRTTWPLMTFDLGIWPLTVWTFKRSHIVYCINKPSLVPSGFQLFKWGHFHIFSLSYNLTSDDLWPWYVIFDLINKWGFPCWVYDPTLFEIHQNMWKVEPNVNLFSQQTSDNNNNRGQIDPYVSFLLGQATQKTTKTGKTEICFLTIKCLGISDFHRVCGRGFLEWIGKDTELSMWKKTPLFFNIEWVAPPPLTHF